MQTIQYNNQTIIPSKVICVGRNYVEHIKELNNETPESMVLFNKPNSAITSELKYIQEDCRFEGEICFLIKNSQIEGIGFGLDLTKVGLQNKMKEKGLPWERAKGFNNSAVFSSFEKFKGDIKTIEMKLYINDKLIQHANYNLMIYKPLEILSEIKTFMSLEDGDVIMSGTPKGVDTYKKNDVFLAFIYINGKVIVKETFVVH
ncbi:MAG: fumarylacetoacetate hydrolase family protein [Epsilonproteobacteria bacterium]|nr:fumarylacetoacetate hydrolase family protein [Campylobacterota bacterium]